MWVFTKLGFVSIVCATDQVKGGAMDGMLMVRARDRKHLEALRATYPVLMGGDIVESPTNDYGFRIFVPKEFVAEFMAALALDVDYTNFKGAVGKQEGSDVYLSVLHSIWSVALRLQRVGKYVASKARAKSDQIPFDYHRQESDDYDRLAAEREVRDLAEMDADPTAALRRLRRGKNRGAKRSPP